MPKPITAVEPKIMPDPKLEKRTRRIFTVEYKLSILQQADACKHGELGALLRREKLYSNQLAQWRREFAEQGVAGLKKSAPDPSSKKTPEQKRIEQLEKENQRLRRQMEVKDGCLMLQKSLGTARQPRRERVMTLLVADSLPDAISERQACDALDVCRNSLRAARKRYFFCGPSSPYRRKRKETVQPKALSTQEREQVKEILYSNEYANQPPVQVYYSLLQHSIYLCSISTMHRLLREESMNGERRSQRPPGKQPVPRLKAIAPRQVWN